MRGFKNTRQFKRTKQVNESIALIAAGSLLSCCFGMLFGGGLMGGVKNLFKWGDDDDDNDNDNNNDSSSNSNSGEKEDNKKEDPNKDFMGLLDMAKKRNEEEKDKTIKKENDQYTKLLLACSFDKDGNEIPFDERVEKMKDALPEGTDFDEFKKKMQEKYDSVKDNEDFKKQLQDEAAKYKAGNYDDVLKAAKEDAKKTWSEIAKEKEEQKKIDDELNEIEKAIKDDSATDEQKKRLEELSKKKQDSTFGTIVPPTTPAGKTVPTIDDDEDVKEATAELEKAKAELANSENRSKEIEEKLKNIDANSEEFKKLTGEKEDLTKKIEEQKKSVEAAQDKVTKARKAAEEKLKKQTTTTTPPEPAGGGEEDNDVDEDDLGDEKLTDEEKESIEKEGAKGAPKPKEPKKVIKRKKERGDGFTYCYKDDREHTLAPGSDEYKSAIRACVLYNKKIAIWKKNNPSEAFISFYKPICEWFKKNCF